MVSVGQNQHMLNISYINSEIKMVAGIPLGIILSSIEEREYRREQETLKLMTRAHP